MSSKPWARRLSTMPSMFSTADRMRRMPRVFAGALSWLGPDGGGWVELPQPEPAVSVGVRTTATSILTSSRPATRAAQLPSTTVLPSSSRPISTKNAVTASRSSTAMLPSPSAGSSWCFSFDSAASHGRVQPSNEQAHDVFDSGTGLRGPPDTKVLMGRESQFEV